MRSVETGRRAPREPLGERLFRILTGSMVYPGRGGMGIVQNEDGVLAKRVVDERGRGKKSKGQSLWQVLEPATIYYGDSHSSLPKHSQVATYWNNTIPVREKARQEETLGSNPEPMTTPPLF